MKDRKNPAIARKGAASGKAISRTVTTSLAASIAFLVILIAFARSYMALIACSAL